MSPLNLSLTDLIANVDDDLPEGGALAKVAEAQARSHTLTALGDQLVNHYVAIARDEGMSWSEIGEAIGVSKQAVQQRHSPRLFNRFTDLARQAVVRAEDAARSRRHDHVGTEHLLFALLNEHRGLAFQLLFRQTGFQALYEAVDRIMEPKGEKVQRGQIPFTADTQDALDAAVAISAELDNDFIGTEHLLLGILAGNGPAKAELGLADIRLENMKPLVAEAIANLQAQSPDRK